MGNPLNDQVVFITGASAGIGAAAAREAAAQGAAVAVCARREDRITALVSELERQGGAALGLRCDVRSEQELTRAAAETQRQLGDIDIAIANAGFGVTGPLAELTLEDYQRQLDTNLFGVLRTIYAVLPQLRASRGCLAVVGSVNGYLGVPGWSAYCVSKAAVRSLCACLRHELAPDGISVTHVAPGFVESEFRRKDNTGALRDGREDPVPPWLQMGGPQASRQMLRAIVKRRSEVVITGHARVAIGLERHAPWLVSGLMGASSKLVRSWSKRR